MNIVTQKRSSDLAQYIFHCVAILTCVIFALTNFASADEIGDRELCLELTKYSPSVDKGVKTYEIEIEKAELACQFAASEIQQDPEIIFSIARIADAKENYEKSFKIYLSAAELGSADAAAEVALAYLNGYGTNISNKNFHQWAKVSHEGGSAQGSYWLGLSYRDGLGVISNSEEAVKYMEIAAERGSSIANIILAYSYALGEMGLDPDRKKAEKYWIVERLRGNDEALVDQHEFELNNPKSPQSMVLALVELEALASEGWTQAAAALSWINTWPSDFQFTETSQIKPLLSAKKGFKYAMEAIESTYFLDNIHFYAQPGIAEKLNSNEISTFLTKLVEISRSGEFIKIDSITATMALAAFEEDGLFAPRNLQKQIAHLEFAASELGYLPAANVLSFIYREDPDVRDLTLAVEFAELATQSDEPYYQAVGYSNLGAIYAYSPELRDFKAAKSNFAKAIEILELSEYTHDEAFLHFARMLILGGNGISRDIDRAKEVLAELETWSDENFLSYFLDRFDVQENDSAESVIEKLRQLFDEGRGEAALELPDFYELIGKPTEQYKWVIVCSLVCEETIRDDFADYMDLKTKGLRGDQIDLARAEALQIAAVQISKATARDPALISKPEKSSKSYEAGRFYALLIGNSSYENFMDLATPLRDIREIGSLLKSNYQASVKFVENGTRNEILSQLSELGSAVLPNDRVLIYFAGHGELKNEEEEGYWLPTDAQVGIDINWISNSYVKRKVKSFKAQNVLIIADTCFSGAMTRGLNFPNDFESPDAIQKFLNTKSRVVISSGGLKPVLDGYGGNHSIFANELIRTLRDKSEPFTASGLYQQLRDKVTEKSLAIGLEQVPLMSNLIAEGHEGPDFVLLPN